MTGTELFTLMDEAGIEYMTGSRHLYKLSISDLADFINDYFLPRPLFEDGTPVKVGDRFLIYEGFNGEVADFCVCDDGSFAVNDFQYDQDQRVMKPEEKPDSWEQIEADEKKNHTEYWGCKGKDDKYCFECEHGLMKSGNSCKTNMYIDLLCRAKELAKGDSE